MARKKKSSPAEDFIAIVALVPWWIGLTIGVVSYFVLHGFAALHDQVLLHHAQAGGQRTRVAVRARAATLIFDPWRER